MLADPGNITDLLRRHQAGDRAAFDELVAIVYDRLRRIARGQAARAWARGTLGTTALVNEAYLRLVGETGVEWQDRGHFFAVAARAMRSVLVDYARRRGALKRGGGKPPLTLEPGLVSVDQQAELVLAVDQALGALEAFNPRLARVVECRFFTGYTEEETATALGVSLRTVQREWMRARAWLLKELAAG